MHLLGTYYLRARYYAPTIGRFTQQDTHWTNANRIYGDSPQKTNEREDRLGIQTYAYVPQISAVMQSGNLYVYCMNDPVMYVDESGESIILTSIIIGAVVGATIGGIGAAVISKNQLGYVDGKWVLIGVSGGSVVGALAGWCSDNCSRDNSNSRLQWNTWHHYVFNMARG